MAQGGRKNKIRKENVMNEKVGEKIKKISKIEWIIGIILAVIETIFFIFVYIGFQRAYVPYMMQGDLGINAKAYSFAIAVTLLPGMIISIVLTLYLFYKSKLMLYAYGFLTNEIHSMNDKLQSLEEKLSKDAPETVGYIPAEDYTRTE